MKIGRAAVFSALLLCTAFAFAQAANPNKTLPSTLCGGINLRAIPGAPFSADVVKESLQVQPGGSSVPVSARGKMFRDSEGRIRSEMELISGASAMPRRVITIVDPVARVSMMLDAQTKTATVTALPASSAAEAARPGNAVAAQKIPAKALAIVGAEELGSSILQGFSVTGSRRARPAAVQSGQKAQSVTLETWFSPELKIDLQAKMEEPDGSVVNTTVQNIVTAEPDRALFEPPADYVVKTLSPGK